MRLRDATPGSTPAPSTRMGWSERVRRDDIPAFEARVRAEGASGYRVFDRTDAVAPFEGLASPAARRRPGSTAAT